MLSTRAIFALAFYILGFHFDESILGVVIFLAFIFIVISLISGGVKQTVFLLFIFGSGIARNQLNLESENSEDGLSKGSYLIRALDVPSISNNDILIKSEISSESGSRSTVLLRIRDAELSSFNPQRIYTSRKLWFQVLNSKEIPGVFNYDQYLKDQGIEYKARVSSSDLLPVSRTNSLWNSYLSLRLTLVNNLRESLSYPLSKELVPALLLGYRSGISRKVKSDLTGAGVVHILAVSGLHLGLIYGMASFILGLYPISQWLRNTLILSLIGIFTLLSGFPISVLRAAALLSSVVLLKGRARGLKATQNLLVLMIFIQPKWIGEIGFQLSALAVLGIIALSSRPSKHWLLKLWNSIKVSLVAQWAVTPIVILVFRVFPVFFLVSNVLILPLVSILLYASLIHWILHNLIDGLSLIEWSINFLVDWITSVSSTINQIEHSKIRIPVFDVLTQWIIIAGWVVISLAFFKPTRIRILSIPAMILIAVIVLHRDMNTEKIIFSETRNTLVVLKRIGMTDSVFTEGRLNEFEGKRLRPNGYNQYRIRKNLIDTRKGLILLDPSGKYQDLSKSFDWYVSKEDVNFK